MVLLAMGGPAGEEEIEDFLFRLLSDPAMVPLPRRIAPALARFIARRRAPKVARRYEAIGGFSPVPAQTRAQAEALGRLLGPGYAVHPLFRYTAPGAGEVVRRLTAEGVRRVVALPLYPQYSLSTTASAVRDLAVAARGRGLEWQAIPSHAEGEGLIEALADRCRPLLPGADHLLMTAHGLPRRSLRRGDPYVREVQATAARLAARLPEDLPWSLAYQSRLGPVRWVKPYLDEEVRRLGSAGIRSLVVVPLSFACENLETLWDLDRETLRLARASGIVSFRRALTPGCHPAYIGELARLVRAAEAEWGVAPAGDPAGMASGDVSGPAAEGTASSRDGAAGSAPRDPLPGRKIDHAA